MRHTTDGLAIPGVLWRRAPEADELPLVLDSPHSGAVYPDDFSYICPLLVLRRAEDAYVDELFAAAPDHGATLIGALFPRSGAARWNTLTLQALGDGILDGALLARYEDAARPEPLRWPEWRAGQLDKAETSLAHLAAHPALLAPGRVDIGTLTVACALWYLDLRFADLGWRDRHPAVAAWYAGFSQRPSLQAAWAL